MPETRRQRAMTAKEEQHEDDHVVLLREVEASPSEMEIQRKKLRQRWELASILNFLNVFEPVIQSNLKISAEEIETALIEPNDSLSQLHIGLLKGVVQSSKTLDVSNAWVSILCKKLAMWWPWVAEGDFPLTAAKGEEMNRYKELDPTIRLFILKALCEIRADQDDIVSYINDTIKNGTGVSTIQKEKLGGDGNGTLYWYDGNAVSGHRLYKEVQVFKLKPKIKGKGNNLGITSHWETLATNFEEFRQVVNEFSSSKVQLEVAVGKAVEANVLPALERLHKKKERVMKQQQRREMLMNAFHTSAITRSGRTRRAVSYRFEEYDRAIEEAIEVTQKRKTAEKQKCEEKDNECGRKGQNVAIEGFNPDHSSDSESTESDTNNEEHQGAYDDHNTDNEHDDISDDSKKVLKNLNEDHKIGQKNHLNLAFQNLNDWLVHKPKAPRCSKRLAGTDNKNVSEGLSLATKHRLRQRPTVNTAIESATIPDSEDENSSENMNKRVRICANSSQAAASGDDYFGS